jgi:competence protein ComEA
MGVIVACLALVSLATSSGRRPGQPGHDSRGVIDADPKEADGTRSGSDAAEALREGRKLDLNAVSAAELELLPGIGPVLAGNIVGYRDRNGRFGEVGELIRVHGIGPMTLGRVRPMVEVRSSPSEKTGIK